MTQSERCIFRGGKTGCQKPEKYDLFGHVEWLWGAEREKQNRERLRKSSNRWGIGDVD